ncbi:G patch domain-containing protein 11 [Grifola frondosa]|uniref:G patch domain-containing protein 11 n=1 Tax=Grifola frondosa TaxID=5627 RepID=A0A1C7MHP7_GRIFR|nr:G patch domain-containing protein 11 [Grifola frondosa]
MADEEDDYLSDKFLLETTSATTSAAKTYAEKRKEAQRLSALKNERNRTKSRRQRELEAREEGLSKSLFERAKEDEASGGQQSKALAMMMKMGFKPGQPLGKREDVEQPPASTIPVAKQEADIDGVESTPAGGPSDFYIIQDGGAASRAQHRVEPLPLNEWAGKKGIGLGKRAASPMASERLAKMAKMAEASDHNAFRDHEKAGRAFNVLWLNPDSPETFPDGLLDALDDPALLVSLQRHHVDRSIEGRLRTKMQADALQPLTSGLEDNEDVSVEKPELLKSPYSEEEIEEAVQFLRLGAKDRLELVLDYLRRKYAYCFWCGTQYDDDEDMEANCPGPDEDAHD